MEQQASNKGGSEGEAGQDKKTAVVGGPNGGVGSLSGTGSGNGGWHGSLTISAEIWQDELSKRKLILDNQEEDCLS